jgi:hypothetical protein
MKEKYCGGCKSKKELIFFSKNQSQCKSCKKKLALSFKKNNWKTYTKQIKERNLRLKDRIDKTLKTCEQCLKVKYSKEFNYPYDKNVKICKECIKENEIIRIKNLKFIKCPKCKEELTVNCFSKNKSRKNKYASLCKSCFKVINKNYKNNNRVKLRETNRNYYYKTRIKSVLRSRIKMALLYSSAPKTKRTFEYLECGLEECRNWLEYQFDEFMNWENYGEYWHIDHVVPCNFFDLNNEHEAKLCFNWRNIRPLEAIENTLKKDKILIDEICDHILKVNKYINIYVISST